ncbi:hypothetical protein [Nocardioides iriomotensis]|uniref:Uncharacterized protein n=1 Tax=Nocardioides iriomotensis TaxID=715784 RepID=A0A4Q5J479_9ACTN|nr:hypothetical protein [Nocardioides iriomotensis]RYU13427.1 hypothetical protein ETU37_06230 [Nocardioides iriomotensis]
MGDQSDQARLAALLRLMALEDIGLSERQEIDRLRRFRLPWSAGTATTALDVARCRSDFNDLHVGIALGAAHRVCSAGEADAALVDALAATRDWLDTVAVHRWRVPDMQARVRRVLVAASPPALLDLSLVRDGDGWGARARDLARELPADAVAPVVRLVGDLGSKRPSKTWHAAMADAVHPEPARALVVGWLRRASDADRALPGRLFCPGNDDLVRASVFAAQHVDDDRLPFLLGALARRGAATSGLPGATEALALKVATAAIDVLGARDASADRAELQALLEDLTRRDLVARVGLLLGETDASERRNELLRRAKASDVRRKADAAPRRRRAAVEQEVRRLVAPVAREHGFAGSGTLLRRRHLDRLDLLAIGIHDGRPRLTFGTRFAAAHPPDEPRHVPMDRTRDVHLDVRLVDDFVTEGRDGLLAMADRVTEVVVPFLDDLGSYPVVRDHLLHGSRLTGEVLDLTSPGSPQADGVLGLLALDARDTETAVAALERRVGFVEERDPDAAELAFWRDCLARALR